MIEVGSVWTMVDHVRYTVSGLGWTRLDTLSDEIKYTYEQYKHRRARQTDGRMGRGTNVDVLKSVTQRDNAYSQEDWLGHYCSSQTPPVEYSQLAEMETETTTESKVASGFFRIFVLLCNYVRKLITMSVYNTYSLVRALIESSDVAPNHGTGSACYARRTSMEQIGKKRPSPSKPHIQEG